MSRVVFRPSAEADLAAIALNIAHDSPKRARAFVAKLRRRCSILENHPEAGRVRNDLGDGLRALSERPYVLLYRLANDQAEVVAVIHGARDLPSALAARIETENKP